MCFHTCPTSSDGQASWNRRVSWISWWGPKRQQTGWHNSRQFHSATRRWCPRVATPHSDGKHVVICGETPFMATAWSSRHGCLLYGLCKPTFLRCFVAWILACKYLYSSMHLTCKVREEIARKASQDSEILTRLGASRLVLDLLYWKIKVVGIRLHFILAVMRVCIGISTLSSSLTFGVDAAERTIVSAA